MNAGMRSLIITRLHKKDEFGNYKNVIGFIDDYNCIVLDHFNQPVIMQRNGDSYRLPDVSK